jgi:ABC-type sugar transport system substrate-binding protein
VKPLRKWTTWIVSILLVAAIVAKAVHSARWHNNVPRMSPPSLDSEYPTARVEAARQAAKKYGGGKE